VTAAVTGFILGASGDCARRPVGWLDPPHAAQMKPLGDGFIKLIKC